MPCDPEIHHRRSIRLKGYDYTQAGAYCVTMVTQDRECLFGEVVGSEMRLNEAGRMLERWLAELGNKYPLVMPGARVVMPNHFHGIIVITDEPVGADLRVCPHVAAHTDDQGAHAGAPLPEIVQWFKTMTTNDYIHGIRTRGWPRFRTRLWQRNYYEHIIRDEDDLDRIRGYIFDNPAQWESDHENPATARW